MRRLTLPLLLGMALPVCARAADTTPIGAGDTLKVAVLTCKPGTSFSAGDDLKTVDEPYGSEPDWEELVMLLPRAKPLIGAVRGHCVGQGLIYLLMLTELRYCTADASFGFPEIRHGMGGASSLTNLARQIPYTVAMQMVLTGEPLAAEAARACHLVNDVVADSPRLKISCPPLVVPVRFTAPSTPSTMSVMYV